MYKRFCDICGKEITDRQSSSKYKLKREDYSWHEAWWVKLDVHDSCYKEMCEYIKAKKNEDE